MSALKAIKMEKKRILICEAWDNLKEMAVSL